MSRFNAVLAAVVVLVVASHLYGLATSPPGFFSDEAAFAYNGWAVMHHGVDEWGVAHPLFFRSFGDYKGPVAMYAVGLVSLVLPMTPYTTRLPNALAGIALSFVAGWLGWRVTRSRAVAILLVLEAGFEPWLFHLGRTMLEADLFTPLCYLVALAALAGGGGARTRNCVIAGAALAIAPLTAQPGRFFTIVVVALLLVAFGRRLTLARPSAIGAPPLITTLLVAAGGGQAVARFNAVSVLSGVPLSTGLGRALGNYLGYFSPGFLFINGDPNLRHSSGFGGMLFVTALVPLVAGLWMAYRRIREPEAQVAVAGIVLGPVGAALTVGINARRDVVVLPFVLLVMALGYKPIVEFLRQPMPLAATVGLLAVLAAVPYFHDYFVAYPARSAAAWEVGVRDAVIAAHDMAAGHTVYLYGGITDPPIVAGAVYLPDPRLRDPLGSIGMHAITSPDELGAAVPGDLVVMAAGDPPPPVASVLVIEDGVARVFRVEAR